MPNNDGDRESAEPFGLRFVRSVLSEPVGLLGLLVAALALATQLGDSASRRDVDANYKSETEAAYRVWFDNQAGWTLWVTALDVGSSVMAPRELEIRPVIEFPTEEAPAEIGEPLTVRVTEFEIPEENEIYRVAVENLRVRVCSRDNGNYDICKRGEVQRFIVTVGFGEDEFFEKRAFGIGS